MSKYTGSLDTNVAMRILLNDIPRQHEKSLKLVEDSRKKFLVSDTVIIEIVYALNSYYGFNREQIADTVTSLAKVPNLVMNHNVILAAIDHFVSHQSLSFEDCYLAESANKNSAEPLFTFDKKLASQHQSAVLL